MTVRVVVCRLGWRNSLVRRLSWGRSLVCRRAVRLLRLSVRRGDRHCGGDRLGATGLVRWSAILWRGGAGSVGSCLVSSRRHICVRRPGWRAVALSTTARAPSVRSSTTAHAQPAAHNATYRRPATPDAETAAKANQRADAAEHNSHDLEDVLAVAHITAFAIYTTRTATPAG